MIVYLASKTRFREDILSNRIEEIVHESLKGVMGKSVGPSELASWKHSLQHMDKLEEQHQVVAEVEARTNAINHLEQNSSFSA